MKESVHAEQFLYVKHALQYVNGHAEDMIIWDRTIYTMWNFLFKQCERYSKTISKWIDDDPTFRKRKSRFPYKNNCVYTLNKLAHLINKQFHTSINLRKVW